MRRVTNLSGRIPGIGSRICQDKRVSDLAGCCSAFWRSDAGFWAGVLGGAEPQLFLVLGRGLFLLAGYDTHAYSKEAKACVIIRSPLYELASPLRVRS